MSKESELTKLRYVQTETTTALEVVCGSDWGAVEDETAAVKGLTKTYMS